MQPVRRPRLDRRPEPDDQPGDPGTGDRHPEEDERQAARHEGHVAQREQSHAEAHELHVAEPAEHPRRGHAAGDCADALQRGEHSEERRGPVQALVEDREDHRLGEPHHEQADTAGEDDLSQHRRPQDVTRPGEQLRYEIVLVALELRLGRAQEQERDDNRDEAGGIENGHGATARRGVDAGTGERCDQPQPLAHRLEHPVRLAEQLARQDHGHQGRPGRRRERPRRAVEHDHGIQQPEVAAVVHEEEQQDHEGLRAVRPDHHAPPRQAVDDEPRDGREQRRQGEREEDEAGGGIAAGQILRPDAKDDEHRPVAEDGQRPAGEEDTRVADAEHAAHQAVGGSGVKAAASAGRSAWTDGPSSACSGISTIERSGDSTSGTTQSVAAIVPTNIVGRRPIAVASPPPASAPSGIVPQTMNRRDALTRPSRRSGVRAWVRLMPVTL